ncbi:MAG TPA: tRNA (adenosine(37)-N6)-threonylcarbamoyltransferase complex dimerization subunit type 1 TsaB [Gemmatimonadaceae bacterium]|nr:tRNA (adenosine(37)-N6)-threonylcarbamoyltransferase complex dimerization subunit type 1 TsaB [Gemmatimonadaceae bacterium]
MITLVVEAATYAGSAALLERGALRGERSVAMRGREHEALMPAVAELLGEQGVAPTSLGRVVCGAGPGSFTSLRIAGAIAKGLALAAACPLVPVSSLALLVASLESLAPGRYLACLDAMRGEHYVGLFEVTREGVIAALGPEGRVASEVLAERARALDAVLVGPGQPGSGDVAPHARAAARLLGMIEASPIADLARWEPAYGRLAEAQVKWEATHGRSLEAV